MFPSPCRGPGRASGACKCFTSAFLSLNPRIIIADEPVSALDGHIQAQVLNLLQELKEQLGLTLLFIAHDLSVVEHICDRIAVMYLGHIMEIDDAEDLLRNPAHPYTEALVSAVPPADPDVRMERIILEGDVPSPSTPPERLCLPSPLPLCGGHLPHGVAPHGRSGRRPHESLSFRGRPRTPGSGMR